VKTANPTPAAGDSVDYAAHAELLRDLKNRLAPAFKRRETRRTCSDMLDTLLMELEDHNCWTMSEAAGHATPDRMQHLLSRAAVDGQKMADETATWINSQLTSGTDPSEVILIADESADEKSSADCAGAAWQYSGTTGGTALCQVFVTLALAAPAGHALIGRSLYLPRSWAEDEERRENAGVPDDVTFRTKPQLAGDLLEHAHDLGIRAAFLAGDEVYSGKELRGRARARGLSYVLACRSNYTVILPSGRRASVKQAASLLKPRMWQRTRTGQATKGAKDYDWAMIQTVPDDTPDGHGPGHAVLLLRRHRYTGTVSYYLCWTPQPAPLAALVRVAVARWRIEEDHQVSKQVAGLDSGQVTTWTSWHRWTALSLAAAAFLAAAAALQREIDGDTSALELVPVSVPELLRLLRGTVIPEPRRDQAHKIACSLRRRHHQYLAQQAHKRWHAYADEIPRAA
jgi:SRSO17 transposase